MKDHKLAWEISRWIVIVLIGIGVAYARVQDVPAIKDKLDATESRVTAMEVSMRNIERGMERTSDKLDRLLERVPRR